MKTPYSLTAITGRKVRADAKLEQLDEAQRERLHFWFEEGYTYAEVVRALRAEFGIGVGRSAVSVYYRRHILPEQREDDAEIVAELAAMPAGDFDAAALRQAKLLLWLAVARPEPDLNSAMKLMAIIDKAERRALAVERAALKAREVVVREKLAAVKLTAAGLKTTKHTKRQERGGEPVEMEARGGGAEIAAKARSGEELSKETTAEHRIANIEQRTPKDEDSQIVAENLPRFPGYSELDTRGAEGAPQLRCRVKAEPGTQSGAENWTHLPAFARVGGAVIELEEARPSPRVAAA